MAFTFQYQLTVAPAGRNDGSAMIDHDIIALFDENGSGWQPVPSHHKTIVVPATDLETVMDMPDATGLQRQAKTRAYKDLLIQYRNATPVPLLSPNASDWSLAGLTAYMAAYETWEAEKATKDGDAATEAGRANTYITVTLGQSYPVQFSL